MNHQHDKDKKSVYIQSNYGDLIQESEDVIGKNM